MRTWIWRVVFVAGCGSAPAAPGPDTPRAPDGTPLTATFSIVARDPGNGDLGVAVASRVLGVGSVVPWAEAGVGAVATQAWANTTFGPEGLRRLRAGESPDTAVPAMLDADPAAEQRQLAVVDAKGRVAAHTGKRCLAWAGRRGGEGYSCQGNILADEGVVAAMAEAFEKAEGELADRLLAALGAGEAAGGDRRGKQSAALLVVRERGGYGGMNDRYVDLRVEDHAEPVAELRRLHELHRAFYRRPAAPPRRSREGEGKAPGKEGDF
ncbi:MAG: DUF1028 domain-containing protein [Planctomycetales bacterium]|nr:DUF1028 domain-containing protein [Planctomycetales bacterium]